MLFGSPEHWKTIERVLSEQANDERLWFQPTLITEHTLQRELRRLHAVLEGKSPEECALEVLRDE